MEPTPVVDLQVVESSSSSQQQEGILISRPDFDFDLYFKFSISFTPPIIMDRFVSLVKSRKIDTALWGVRLITMILCVLYLIPIPIFGSPTALYYKALMSNAATSALRLHQRIPQVSFTRMFLAQLLLEDSCHYLFYSIIFIYCSPITLALVPILLFAVLHFSSYSLTVLDAIGRSDTWIGRALKSVVEFQTVTILRMIAGAEILTMVFTVIYTFMGRASFVTPFIYYRFLTLRYASRRNHYSRVMFYEFRIQLEQIAYSSKCPGIFSTAIRKSIETISRFAPEIAQAPPTSTSTPPPTNS